MGNSQSVAEVIWHERNDADAQMRPIIHIRITTDGIPGSPAALPVTPERARTLGKLWAFPNGSVDAAYDGRALEVLVHPEDWAGLLKDVDAAKQYAVQIPLKPNEPYRVFGISVSES